VLAWSGEVASSRDSTQMTAFEEVGEALLTRVIDDFVERMVGDVMIGFFFRNVDHARLKRREYELAARHLGADVPYSGRPLDVAHAPHPIQGGQFMRRLQLLKKSMDSHGLPERARAILVAETERLRPLVTRDAGSDCDAEGAGRKVSEHFASLRKDKA